MSAKKTPKAQKKASQSTPDTPTHSQSTAKTPHPSQNTKLPAISLLTPTPKTTKKQPKKDPQRAPIDTKKLSTLISIHKDPKIDQNELKRLLATYPEQHHSAGGLLVKEDKEYDFCLYIHAGRASVHFNIYQSFMGIQDHQEEVKFTKEDRKSTELALLHPGDLILDDLILHEGTKTSFTVITQTDCVVKKIPLSDFRRVLAPSLTRQYEKYVLLIKDCGFMSHFGSGSLAQMVKYATRRSVPKNGYLRQKNEPNPFKLQFIANGDFSYVFDWFVENKANGRFFVRKRKRKCMVLSDVKAPNFLFFDLDHKISEFSIKCFSKVSEVWEFDLRILMGSVKDLMLARDFLDGMIFLQKISFYKKLRKVRRFKEHEQLEECLNRLRRPEIGGFEGLEGAGVDISFLRNRRLEAASRSSKGFNTIISDIHASSYLKQQKFSTPLSKILCLKNFEFFGF